MFGSISTSNSKLQPPGIGSGWETRKLLRILIYSKHTQKNRLTRTPNTEVQWRASSFVLPHGLRVKLYEVMGCGRPFLYRAR